VSLGYRFGYMRRAVDSTTIPNLFKRFTPDWFFLSRSRLCSRRWRTGSSTSFTGISYDFCYELCAVDDVEQCKVQEGQVPELRNQEVSAQLARNKIAVLSRQLPGQPRLYAAFVAGRGFVRDARPWHHEVTCGDANQRLDVPQAQLFSAAPKMRVDSCEPNIELARHVARRHPLSQAAKAFPFAVGEQCQFAGNSQRQNANRDRRIVQRPHPETKVVVAIAFDFDHGFLPQRYDAGQRGSQAFPGPV